MVVEWLGGGGCEWLLWGVVSGSQGLRVVLGVVSGSRAL